MNYDLSKFCSTGGCGAKLDAEVLHGILDLIPKKEDKNLLVGFDSSDDGSVYKINEDLSIINTLDFFTPIVDDPYTFGQIAAANALSDIYAMGGTPITALNIVCFPRHLSPEILINILKGGADKAIEANCTLSGGHSINDETIKYGLSVTGVVDTNSILKNNTPNLYDDLILTKPLGVGIIMCAKEVNDYKKSHYEMAVKSMTTLNKYAFDIISKYPISSLTDITGFGLLGHLSEMATDYSFNIYYNNILKLDGAEDYAKEFYTTAAGQKNRNHLRGKINFNNFKLYMEEILFDPQTSGGLAFSISKEYSKEIIEKLKSSGIDASIIGQVKEKDDFSINVFN